MGIAAGGGAVLCEGPWGGWGTDRQTTNSQTDFGVGRKDARKEGRNERNCSSRQRTIATLLLLLSSEVVGGG